jgi:subtilisin family serine protease
VLLEREKRMQGKIQKRRQGMIRQMLLGFLTVVALLLANIDVSQAQGTRRVIAVFRADVSFESFEGAYQPDERARINPEAWTYVDRRVFAAVQALEQQLGFSADHVYSAALRGFAARMTEQQISVLENDPSVAYVEDDVVMTAKVQDLPWGIDRIDADVSSTLAGNGSGAISNVSVYIIDSGVDIAHDDLDVLGHVKLLPFPLFNNKDCNGHGTHVAGTAAAIDNDIDVVGVAPGAPLYGLKVLNCLGSGPNSGTIKAVDLVTANGTKPGVVNMSLGGAASQALDDAIVNSVNSGFFYAVAAGNENADACNGSPSRNGLVNGVVSVAAVNVNELEADFSNFGDCVDIWAPGVDVLSTALGGGTTTLSGTSMSSPHVAGAAALYLSNNPTATPAQVESAIKAAAVATGTNSKDGRPIVRLNVGGF